jgi:UDP-glucose 4-epimerase
MKVLISGGFGLIAGRLAELFSNSGHEVWLASRTSKTKVNSLSKINLIKINWDDEVGLERICSGMDIIIHAAGMNAQDCFISPTEALYFNGIVTARFVNAAVSQSVEKFIYISTAHVYSADLDGQISEKSCATNLHPYATSHRSGEDAVLFANQQGKIQGIVTRLSNSFGYPISVETNCWSLLINDLCRQAIQLGVLSLNTYGTQHRDFISLKEVCNAILFLSETKITDACQPIFNIGLGKSAAIIDICNLVQNRCNQILGYKPEILRPLTDKMEEFKPFMYQIENLSQLGYMISDDISSEIDELLRYCSVNFKRQ